MDGPPLIQEFFKWGRTIVAIGRNYAAHAKELGNEVPSSPFYFLKPASSYVHSPGTVQLPAGVGSVHHEIELGVIVGRQCKRLASRAEARAAIGGYTLALDLTARDEQAAAKAKGRPWSQAKGYDTFTPVGDWVDPALVADDSQLRLELRVNGQLRQSGSTSHMLHDVPALLMYVSSVMTLNRGDLLLTGTPEGVGPIVAGDQLEGRMLLAAADDEQPLTAISFAVEDQSK